MRYLIALSLLLVSLFTSAADEFTSDCIQVDSSQGKADVVDYESNEINRRNTFNCHILQQFTVENQRFGLGFYRQVDNNNILHPFLALIVWEPTGWKTLAKMPALWNGNLAMYTGTAQSDLENYMWFIGEQFTTPLRNYLAEKNELVIPEENWKKILLLMSTVRMENGRLEFNRSF